MSWRVVSPFPPRRWSARAGLLAALSFAAGHARGAISPIQPSHIPGELNVQQVLGLAYGGTFTAAANGNDFSNGTITATRGDDSSDQLFNQQTIASARAVYDPDAAEGALAFGYLPGATGTAFTPLFKVSGSGANVSGGTASSVTVPSSGYRFALQRGTQVTSSQNSDNPDGQDHMVSFQVSGPGLLTAGQNWLLGFETSSGHPFDYNQAFSVQTATPVSTAAATPSGGASPIPVLPALWSGTLGMGGLTLVGLFRRLRRAMY